MPYSGQVSIDAGPPQQAAIEVTDEAVVVAPAGRDPITLAFVDIDDLWDDNYTMRLTDFTGRHIDLSMLGIAYGQILADVRNRRDEKLQRDLLLTGVKLQDSFPGKIFGGEMPIPAEIRVFEDLIVFMPERALMWGLPYTFVESVDWNEDLYQLTITSDDGRKVVLGHLAKRSEELREELLRLLAALEERTAAYLEELLGGDAEAAGKLAPLLRDGRAVQQSAIDAVDATLFPRLEEIVVGMGPLRETYQALKARSPVGSVALGIKQVKNSTSHITWFFCPIGPKAVAQEITSEEGHATYVFRVDGSMREGIATLNRALLTLNFRREPIYLSDEVIATGDYSRYRVALRQLDYLRWTRAAFLGRAIHNATWARQVEELIATA